MVKNAYIITSAIEVDNNYPFDLETHNSFNMRSGISSIERFRQTICTVKLIKAADPKSKIYIVDTSINYSVYEELFKHFPYVEYFPVNKYDKEIAKTANRFPCKAYCELIIKKLFIREKINELENDYDFIIKVSGRYTPLYNINELEKGKFLTTDARSWGNISPLCISNPDLKMIDLTDKGEPELKYYSSAIFGFDAKLLNYFYINILDKMIDITGKHWGISYEMLLYYLLFPTKDTLVKETNWKIFGFSGIGNIWSVA